MLAGVQNVFIEKNDDTGYDEQSMEMYIKDEKA